MKKNTIITLVLLSTLFVAGCNPSGGPADKRRYFLLDVQRDGQTLKPQGDVVLMVRPFSLAPGYHKNELTYRTGVFQYESDYYNLFITDIGQQVAGQTRGWLSHSGYFTHVVHPGSTMNATHILEGNITRLYGDFRDKKNPEAFMEITFYLVDITKRKPSINFSVSFEVKAPITELSGESLVEAYQNCLQQILGKLENRLVNGTIAM
ncbi:MAG: hypothetical protein K9M57_08475 [Phycisphaerae bacterium]|nr:hypothetical protein [Phycisphaerae bacterium]